MTSAFQETLFDMPDGEPAPPQIEHFYDWPITTGEVSQPVPHSTVDTVDERTKPTPFERLEMFREDSGFTPQSPRELNLALGYLENRDKPGGYGRYLHEVQIHQNRSTSEDPSAAVRKITTEVANFALISRDEDNFLTLLEKELPEGNLEVLATSANLEDWKHQPSTKRSLRGLAYEQRIRQCSPDNPEIDLREASDEEIVQLLTTMRRYEAVRLIDSLHKQLEARNTFWKEVLDSSRSHLVARPIADRALRSLGIN